MERLAEKVSLLGFLPEELEVVLPEFKKFKVAEIFRNFSRKLFSFEEHTTLTLSEREFLAKNFLTNTTKIAEHQTDEAGTQKLSLEIDGGHIIEAVLLIDKNGRKTACVSSQAGCPLGCKFCKTGLLGFARNLTTAEIVEQFFLLEKIAGAIDNIVFMGMGEPLLNFDCVKKAILIITHKLGRNFSKRRITISTSGLIEGIYRLARELPEIRLAVSLTAANQVLRENLMPIAKTNDLDSLKEALSFFGETSKRRITLEVALMHAVNTDEKACIELISFARSTQAHVNLIPWNPTPELNFKAPTEKEVNFVFAKLQNAHINVTRRRKQGQEISGACGQLGKIKGTSKNS